MIKIIGGEFRSRILQSPEGHDVTRPMPGMIKESIFNILRGWFEDANVLDLFAGSGSMGLEAVSRGAKRVLMVEKDRETHEVLRANIALLGCEDRAEAILGDALSPLVAARVAGRLDIVFVDPPYPMVEHAESRARVLEAITLLKPLMAEKAWVVLRTPVVGEGASWVISGFRGPETHAYGADKQVHLYMPDHSE